MSLYSDTVFWFRVKKSLLFLLNVECLEEKPILKSLVWSDMGSNPRSTALETSTIIITPSMWFDHLISLSVINVASGFIYCVINWSPDLTRGIIYAVTGCHPLCHRLLTWSISGFSQGHKVIMQSHRWFHSFIIWSHSKCQKLINWSHWWYHKFITWYNLWSHKLITWFHSYCHKFIICVLVLKAITHLTSPIYLCSAFCSNGHVWYHS